MIESLSRTEAESPAKRLSKSFNVPPRLAPDPLDSIKRQFQDSEWLSRIEALSKLQGLIHVSKTLSSKGLKCLVAALSDSDSRVTMQALSVATQVLPLVDHSLDLSPLLPSLAVLLNSMNNLLRNNAKETCKVLIQYSDPVKFVPTLIAELHRQKDRVWLFLFNLLVDAVQPLCATQAESVRKHLVDYAKGLAARPMHGASRKFVDKLYEVLGEELPLLMGDLWEHYTIQLSV